jgi:hypothetical protein
MKYLKSYEKYDISLSDFINKKNVYWRYTNDLIDCIMKLEKFSETEYAYKSNFIFKVLILGSSKKGNKEKNTFTDIVFDSNGLFDIIKLKCAGKILRPATEEEIEKFDLLEVANKYNL